MLDRRRLGTASPTTTEGVGLAKADSLSGPREMVTPREGDVDTMRNMSWSHFVGQFGGEVKVYSRC